MELLPGSHNNEQLVLICPLKWRNQYVDPVGNPFIHKTVYPKPLHIIKAKAKFCLGEMHNLSAP